jgi:hypothetical protein
MPEPTDFDLDGALSAELDGDLPAWCEAEDRDLTVIQARLAAPEAVARRTELATARNALAASVAPPDELTRRRLLGAALTDAEPDTTIPHRSPGTGPDGRSRRVWVVLAGVAAALLLMVAVVAVVNGGGDDGTAKSSGSATADAPKGDLGDVGPLDQAGVDKLINGGAAAGRRPRHPPPPRPHPARKASPQCPTPCPRPP